MKRLWLIVSCVGVAALGCGDPKTATQIMVIIDADSVVRSRADAVRVTLQGSRGADLGDETNVDYGPTGDEPLVFPLRIAVVPEGGDASRVLTVRAAALDSGTEIVVATAVTGFVENELVSLQLLLGAQCIGASCPEGQTCNPDDGMCVSAMRDPTMLPRYDGAVDSGIVDGGTLDSGVDAADTAVDTGCADGTRCEGDMLFRCSGGVETSETCARACGDRAGVDACLDIAPRNIDDETALTLPGTASLEWIGSESVIFDTSTGRISVDGTELRPGVPGLAADIHFTVLTQAMDEPLIAVWSIGQLTLAAGSTIDFAGTNAVALLSSGDIVVAGRIDASADRLTPGPGGYTSSATREGQPPPHGGGRGESVRISGTRYHSVGAGGGGGSGVGGDGGDDDPGKVSIRGAMGGAVVPLGMGTPLVGGASGGGNESTVRDATGGGGGGALSIFSATSIEVAATGVLAAHGGGAVPNNPNGGNGGGAGGMILLEAPMLTVDGGLYSNGGGGAGGSYEDEPSRTGTGANGRDGSMPAPGGTGDSGGGNGGNGGAGDAVDGLDGTDGMPRTTGTSTAGGGGGAAGRLYFATDVADFTPGGTLSPGVVGQTVLPMRLR